MAEHARKVQGEVDCAGPELAELDRCPGAFVQPNCHEDINIHSWLMASPKAIKEIKEIKGDSIERHRNYPRHSRACSSHLEATLDWGVGLVMD